MAIIEVSNLGKSFSGVTAVADLSFRVERGEVLGILGSNGAGKTTAMECMIGLQPRTSGTVSILGADPAVDRQSVRQTVGVQLQSAELDDRIRVAEALRLYASFYPHPADVDDLMQDFGLSSHRDASFATLSGGQQQRLSIALALVGSPQIVVLDELTTGLDPQGREETWAAIESLRDRGVTVLLVTHFMDEAERLCDRLLVIDRGRLRAEGTVAELVAQSGHHWRITATTPESVTAEAIANLSALDSIATLTVDGGQLTATGSSDAAVGLVLAASRLGMRLGDVEVRRPSLSDAVLSLTGREAS